MAIVNALKFDDYSGAIIADEEYWMQRRRKSYFRDNLYDLVTDKISDTLNLEAVYGGFGNPSFDYEVVSKARGELQSVFQKFPSGKKTGGKSTGGFTTVEDVGKILLETIQKTCHRRTNNTLNYLFGFGIDDFNRGYYTDNDVKYDIKQDTVKKQAMDIVEGKHKLPFVQPISDSRGILIGYDPVDGFGCYYVNVEKSVLSYTSGGFEAIGSGKYAAGISFGKFLNKRTLAQRQKGMDRVEGMVELILSAIATKDHYFEVGGYFNIVYVDGRQKIHRDRYLPVFDHRAHLATEIVRSYQAHMIKRDTAFDLIDRLVFKRENFDRVEDDLFKKCSEPRKLEKILRGYKLSFMGKSKSAASETRSPGKKPPVKSKSRRVSRGR